MSLFRQSIALAHAKHCVGSCKALRWHLQSIAIITIVSVYALRNIIGLGSIVWFFSYLELFSSLTPAFLVWCYMPGICKN